MSRAPRPSGKGLRNNKDLGFGYRDLNPPTQINPFLTRPGHRFYCIQGMDISKKPGPSREGPGFS